MWNSLKTKGAIAENGTKHKALWIWENSSSSERRKEIALPLWQLGSFLESPKKEVILYGHTTKNAMWVSHVMSILICPKKKNSLLVQNLGKMTEKNVLDLLGYLMCHFVLSLVPFLTKMLCWIALSNDSNLYSSSHHCHSYSQLHTFMSKKGNNPGNGMGS